MKPWLSLIFLIFIGGISMSAELWSNNRPLILKYEGEIYFPAIVDYHPEELEIHDRLKVNYKTLSNVDWALWPPNPWGPYEINRDRSRYPAPPSRENWLGTDDRGRDVLARMIYGSRLSFIFALSVWLSLVLIGCAYGLTSGYLSGKVDIAMQRFIEIFSSIPHLFILLFLASIFEPRLWMLAVLSALLSWMGLSVYIRAETLKARSFEFVEAARAQGAGTARILWRHILPNILTPIITFSPFIIMQNIVGLAVLDFLGFGLQPPTASWGELLQQGKNYFNFAWWLALYPALVLFLVLYSVNQVGEAIRMALDPHEQEVT